MIRLLPAGRPSLLELRAAVGLSLTVVAAVAAQRSCGRQFAPLPAFSPLVAAVSSPDPTPAPTAALPAAPSGPGIQICEPVAAGGDATLADFGSGCGLWLQWSMGFQPELGQTPRWDAAPRAARELHIAHLRVPASQAARLGNILGATHVAVGQISGTAGACRITYQIYAVPGLKPVGAPIRLSGSRDEVTAALPGAARAVLRALGVKAPRVPDRAGATPEELAALGRYGPSPDLPASADDQKRISELSARIPLATLLLFSHYPGHTADEVELLSRRVMAQSAGNFLMLGVVAAMAVGHSQTFVHELDALIDPLHAPGNAVLAYWPLAVASSPEVALRAAQRIVRLAPRSPNAWNLLAVRYGQQSQAIRLSRVYAGLSASEANTLSGLYAEYERAAARAVALDPDYQAAWLQLATAATFAGDPARADAAFWKARRLDPGAVPTYTWGLEMYQSKWGGSPATLARVAHLAAAAPFPAGADLYSLGLELKSAGFPAEAQTLFSRAVTQARSWVQQLPNDYAAHSMLGTRLEAAGEMREAEAEHKTAVKLGPTSYPARMALARLLRAGERYPEAITELREALRIAEAYGDQSSAAIESRTLLAEALMFNSPKGPFDEPELLLNAALKAQPRYYQAIEDLGWLFARSRQFEAAITQYEIAESLAPDNYVPHQEIGRIFRLQGRLDAAAKEGEAAVAMAPKSYTAQFEVAETYAAQGDLKASEGAYRLAIAAAPEAPAAHFGLAGVLLRKRSPAEARAELKRVLELNADADMRQSAQSLLQKNP